ncbi:putative uncharacterized protein [Clostridium sp. CAG:710]|nr:putative uncharacterized protein [Clostridium sp. CAG:710]
MKNNLFIPMYIDKVKLFDLNSIINGGFNEFNEISLCTDNNANAELKGKMGFNLFKLNGNIESGISKFRNKKVSENAKYIQTSASMLSNIYSYLKENKKIKSIRDCKIGDFVELNLAFNSNSIVEFLKECHTLMDFANKTMKLEKSKKQNTNLDSELKIIDSLINLVDDKTNVVEYVGEDENAIYVVYLNKDYLYHTQLERLDNQKLKYLAQVINITNQYNFCSDTVLSKINAKQIKDFIDAIKNIGNQDIFSKNFDLKTENNGKKVIILDVISILRVENQLK